MIDTPADIKVLKPIEVENLTSLSRTTIWRLERNGDFPPRIHLSANRVGWLESDLFDWLVARRGSGGGKS